MMRLTSSSTLTALEGLVLSAAASGCDRSGSILSPAASSARSVATLGEVILIGFCAVSVAMVVLIVWAAARRRGTLDEHAPVEAGGGQWWLVIGGFLAPALVMAVVFGSSLRMLDRFPLHDGGHYRPDIRVIGHQWWWEIQYTGSGPGGRIVTANEMHVPVGWPVEIELESRDVIHSFWVPDLQGKVDLIPGHFNRIRIDADKAGRFDGRCSQYCGAEHTLMNLSVVAEPIDDYEKWLAGQAAPSVRPVGPDAVMGQRIFETRACGICHTVRGTPALSQVGPDLTHIASRSGLAAYALPNSRAYLEAWIVHAQSFKPGSQMPNLTEFSGAELQALTRYLEQLQ